MDALGDVPQPLAALGLLLLGYPLHPAGKPDQPRVEHLGRIRVPTLLVSGTRDALGSKDALRRAARRIRGPVSWHWVETGDHSFKPLRSSGRSLDEVLADLAEASAEWVAAR